jgi:hypothetical protein
MNVRVVKRENPYAQIDKMPINDRNLSPESLGVLTYILSKPNDWKAHKKEILKRFQGALTIKATQNKIDNVFIELRKAGYIKICHIKDKKTGLIKGSEYQFFETPDMPISSTLGDTSEQSKSSHLGTSLTIGNVPILTEEMTLLTNNELKENKRESEKEFSQPLPPVSEIQNLDEVKHPDEVNDDLINNPKGEIKENTPQVPPTPLKEIKPLPEPTPEAKPKKSNGFMVYSQNEFEENLMMLFSEPMNKDELRAKLKKFKYSETGIISRNQAEIMFSVFADWLLKEKDPENFMHYFSPSIVKRDFLSALSWIISKEVVKNAFKKPFQNVEKPNYAPSTEKPRYA